MESIRRYVFPVIWMLVLAVIAAALAKLAFFPGDDGAAAAGDDQEVPAASFDQWATVPVERGDITSELALSATVEPDAGTALRADHEGEINYVWVDSGDQVAEGDSILQVRVPREPDPVDAELGADGEELPSAPQESQETEYSYFTLRAESAGIVRDFEAVVGQSLAVGDPVATLSPGTYSIVADLTPEQQLDLLDTDIDASAQLPTSSDPVACEAPSIEEDDADDATDQPEDPDVDPMTGEPLGGDDTSVAQLRCPVPEETRIVPGLEVDVTVDLGGVEDVLLVPVTAAVGELAAGGVYVLDDETGEPVEVPVELGMRDDSLIEVVDGLEEGQEILQFVPGVDNPDGGMDEGMGVEVW